MTSSTCTPSVIRTTGLKRQFGRLVAVDALDLEVPTGQVTGFLGPNGAGKTTTLRLLLGLLQADAGSIEIFGTSFGEVSSRGQREEILGRVGALIETPSLYLHLTGRENLEVSRKVLGRVLGVRRSRVQDVLALAGLTYAADRLVGEYSLGMRQRLGLALALLPEPELLILDEPTNGLDPAGIQEMRQLIGDLPHQAGVSVFLSSHLLAEVEQVASHLVILHRGHCLFQGRLEELRARRQGCVTIGVERPADAATLLAGKGWASQVDGPGALLVDASGQDARIAIGQTLFAAGFAVDRLDEQPSSLEATFLEMTS